MATTTVRLDPDDENTLDHLAAIHGGRSRALRLGLQLLAAETERRTALGDLLAEWEAEAGAVTETALTAMTERYRLDP